MKTIDCVGVQFPWSRAGDLYDPNKLDRPGIIPSGSVDFGHICPYKWANGYHGQWQPPLFGSSCCLKNEKSYAEDCRWECKVWEEDMENQKRTMTDLENMR